MRSRSRSITISSSSTSSTRGTIASAGWSCVMTDSSVAGLPSGLGTGRPGQRRAGFSKLDAQTVHVQAGVDARDELGLAHALGEIVVDAGAIAAFEVEVV